MLLTQPGSVSPTPAAAVPVGSFEGLYFGTNGPYSNRLTPPDVQVAVGPNHVVEMVNVLGRISTKQGVEVQTFPLDSFFGVHSTDFISDPKVHFDTASSRWFASMTDVTTGRVLLEVSKSDDPTGLWNAYSVSTITGCADQPLLGFSDLVVIISANDFSSCTSGSPSYLGVQYWVLNKTDLLSGATPRTMSFGPDPTLFSVHPVQSLRSTDTVHGVDRERPREHPHAVLRHRRPAGRRACVSTEFRDPIGRDASTRASTRIEVHPRYGGQPGARRDVGRQPPVALFGHWLHPCG